MAKEEELARIYMKKRTISSSNRGGVSVEGRTTFAGLYVGRGLVLLFVVGGLEMREGGGYEWEG